MRNLMLFLLMSGLTAPALADEGVVQSTRIIALHQLDDEAMAGFDFFSAEALHQCGDKPSNRFRSYSRNAQVAERKFQLVLTALSQNMNLGFDMLGCEGNAMTVGRIGIRR